jgi:hypothetical protein
VMLSHDSSLHERLRRVADDLGSLSAVAAIGYRESDASRVLANLKKVAGDRSFTLIDLRDSPGDDSLLASKASRLVVAARAGSPPPVLLRLVRGAIDARPANRQIFVLFEGAAEMVDVAAEYHAIPFWDFLP